MDYRADIDGLRAVAVLPVVGYHAGLDAFSGGYVGVDVFFVISGYLIGSIIIDECRAGTFSLARFYERRVRRIIPALLAVIVATMALAYLYALPAELAELGRSVTAALVFASNIYFWQHSGYFDAPAEAQPLLHIWSLAVEEQFYLFMPLAVVAAFRWFPRGLAPAVVAAAALSFALSVALTPLAPTASFYLLPTRAWELLLGVAAALAPRSPPMHAATRNLLAAAGLAMIAVAVFAYTPDTSFPGLPALLPCAGALLVIVAGRGSGNAVGALLAWRPIVFVGLISYSLYLWHWPIMVFQRSDAFLIAGAPPAVETTVVIAASFVAAVLSWRYVERPFRSPARIARPALISTAFVATAAVASTAIAATALDGLPSRYPPTARAAAAYLEYDESEQYRVGRCMLSDGFAFEDFERATCLARSATKPDYLLVGDSHAAHLWWGLEHVLSGVNIMQATASGCKPTLVPAANEAGRCRRLVNFVLHDEVVRRPVDALLIAANWRAEDVPALRQTLAWAQRRGVRAVLIGPVVQYDDAVPRLLANALRRGVAPALAERRLEELSLLDDRLERLAAAHGARYVSLWDAMCSQPACLAYVEGFEPRQFDYGHLTREGSIKVAELLRAAAQLP